MAVLVSCVHCNTTCQLAEQHLGMTVQCGQCGKMFTARARGPAAQPLTVLPVSEGPPRLDVAAATSAGRVRHRNEDSFLIQQLAWSNLDERHHLALLVVADGMGGHEAGDRASGMVIRNASNALAPLLAGALSGQFKDSAAPELAQTIDFALHEANRAVYRKARGDAACKGMGATAALVLVWDGHALIGHVGDCRVYHARGGRLSQITKDQTLVARMVELGQLTPAEAVNHPSANEVSQAVGRHPKIEPAAYQLKLAAGDWLLAACDGLEAHLDRRTLQEEVTQAGPSAARLADRLVELADQRGGSDNCTVVAARCC